MMDKKKIRCNVKGMIRRLFWLAILVGVYGWLVHSGNDQRLWKEGQVLYQQILSWFDETEFDLHIKKEKKRPSRRWE